MNIQEKINNLKQNQIFIQSKIINCKQKFKDILKSNELSLDDKWKLLNKAPDFFNLTSDWQLQHIVAENAYCSGNYGRGEIIHAETCLMYADSEEDKISFKQYCVDNMVNSFFNDW